MLSEKTIKLFILLICMWCNSKKVEAAIQTVWFDIDKEGRQAGTALDETLFMTITIMDQQEARSHQSDCSTKDRSLESMLH